MGGSTVQLPGVTFSIDILAPVLVLVLYCYGMGTGMSTLSSTEQVVTGCNSAVLV